MRDAAALCPSRDAEQHRGSHFKQHWRREGLQSQSHVGRRNLARAIPIVQLFLFKEERILIACCGERDN